MGSILFRPANMLFPFIHLKWQLVSLSFDQTVCLINTRGVQWLTSEYSRSLTLLGRSGVCGASFTLSVLLIALDEAPESNWQHSDLPWNHSETFFYPFMCTVLMDSTVSISSSLCPTGSLESSMEWSIPSVDLLFKAHFSKVIVSSTESTFLTYAGHMIPASWMYIASPCLACV